jgi:pimeloyl-ACP methyl ester carboxylesterase
MATFVLIPGAGGAAWYWHRLVPQLCERGHDAVDGGLPAGDDTAGLAQYADAVIEAVGDRTDLVVVAQSMRGFTAPIVCERVLVDLLVMDGARRRPYAISRWRVSTMPAIASTRQ